MSCDPQPYIMSLTPYQPGLPIELVARKYGLKPADIIKLASNENPLGMSPKARQAIDAALKEGHRYPENYALEQALARFYDIPMEQIVVANGSTGVLDLIAKTFLGEGCEAISSEYAFAMYPIMTQTAGALNVVVPAQDYGHDLDAMAAAVTPKTRVMWVTNPNNPTGTFVPYGRIKAFLERIPKQVTVVLDEAYYEFLEPADRAESHNWVTEYTNVIVVRTFSKVHGLAGVRVGYAVAHPSMAGLLNRVRYPFTVSATAVAGAVAALDDAAFIAKSVELNRVERKRLIDGLEAMGLRCLPAYGNFVTFQCEDALAVNQKLLEQGVIIRPMAGYKMVKWLRVSVGLPEENQRFLQTLAEVLRP